MNKFLIIAALAAVSLMPTATLAAPLAWYNAANGGIWFRNDTDAPLPNASLLSQSGLLKDAASLLTIPGTIKDDSEFPFAYTYLNLPVGDHFTGYTVKPGTLLIDLTFQYRIGSLTSPPISQSLDVPEPSTCLLAVSSALVIARLRRTGRQRVPNPTNRNC